MLSGAVLKHNRIPGDASSTTLTMRPAPEELGVLGNHPNTAANHHQPERCAVKSISKQLFSGLLRRTDQAVHDGKSRLPQIASVGENDSSFRTSHTCDLGVLDDPLIQDIDCRICSMMGIDASYSEVIQGQYYDVGQQFKAHTDFFEADQLKQYATAGGQRTYTFFIYLNDVEAGGETEFLRLGVKIKPKRGRALIWNNLTPQGIPNHNTIHQAHPVRLGYKCVITKWFRADGI